MITAVLTSDNHLGTYYARLKPERLERRRQRLQRAFTAVVDAAIAMNADLFLHAGDLFDRPDPRNAERLFVARQFSRLREAGISVFAVAGNHDSPRSLGYDGGTVPQEEMQALDSSVHLFRKTDALEGKTLTIRNQTVRVWGVSSDFNRPAGECPIADLTARHERETQIDIVLLHYGIEGRVMLPATEPVVSRASLEQWDTDAFCIGHLHTRYELRLTSGTPVLNPGSTEHMDFGEDKNVCGYAVLRLEPGKCGYEFVAIETQPMQTLRLEIPDDVPDDDLMAHLTDEIAVSSAPDQLLRVRLQGTVLRARFQALDLPRLQRAGEAKNFSCDLETSALIVMDDLENWQVAYGVSFDVAEEMAGVAAALQTRHGNTPYETEICRLAGERLAEAHARITGGAF